MTANSSSGITVTPQVNGFGAEITGIDISSPLPAQDMAVVRDAWAKHSVLYFPDQPLTVEQQEMFTLQFGDFGVDPFVKAMADHPHVLELRREPDEKAIGFGAAWHSDWSFQEHPPSATILHSKVTPPVGGDTLFADCYSAYDALSPVFRNCLRGLRAIHSASRPYGRSGIFAEEKEKRAMSIIVSAEAEKTFSHPLVRVHPVTGRSALFISPTYTLGIEGMGEAESAHILAFLYEHITQDRFVYRHKWKQNMLTLWDNRCTLHNADGGYDGHLRVLHRTTVAGERPV